jgi:hypothetical protein
VPRPVALRLVRALSSVVCIAGAASTPCQPHGQCCRGTACAGMSRQNRRAVATKKSVLPHCMSPPSIQGLRPAGLAILEGQRRVEVLPPLRVARRTTTFSLAAATPFALAAPFGL